MRRLTILINAVFVTALLFVFAGCQDKDYYNPNGPGSGNSENPSLNNFATSKDVVLNLDYGVNFEDGKAPEGLISVFDVYTENPLELKDGRYALNQNLIPIAGGICVGGNIQINKTVPASAKELYVYSNDLFVPMLMSAKIEGTTANFEVVDLTIESSDVAGSRAVNNNTLDGYLNKGSKTGETTVGSTSDINSSYRPNYILETKSGLTKYINRIKSEFTNGVAVKNKDYYHDAILYLYEDAEDIKLSMIHGDASYQNSLSYFFYEGTPEEAATINKSKVKEIVALPYAKLDNGLKAGQMVQLMYYNEATKKYVKKFPKGTTIGFILRSDAFRKPSGSKKAYVETSEDKFFSLQEWNKSFDSAFPQHTIYFNAAVEGEKESFICFGFEDTKGGGDKDCNDVMFHVDINPADAIEEPPHIPEVGEVVTSETRMGTLGFEDNWPWKGDYDLNDVVVTYSSKTTYVQKTLDGVPTTPVMVRSIEDKIKLVHSSADFTNAFGYKLGFSDSYVKSATKDGSALKLESDGDGFIVNITDNVGDAVQCVNPSKHVYICTPKTMIVKLAFNEEGSIMTQEAYNKASYATAPYNPFISPSSYEGVEVHLPFFPPTTKVNMDHFGKTHDRSDPASNRWYVGSEDNPYPFAIHLFNVDGFKKIPVENKEINHTYPDFTKWVSSNLTENLNWYENPANVD